MRRPIGHGGAEHGDLRERDGASAGRRHGHGASLKTVSNAMVLKRSSGAGPRSTFMRNIAPCHEASKNSARSVGSKVVASSPEACASAMQAAKGARHSS